jgi:thiol:disulfide interchange protein
MVHHSRMKVLLQTLLCFCLALSASAAAKTEVHLVLSAESAKPGDTVWAGVSMQMPADWHSYWRNAGDSGIPTSIKWTLPKGIKAGEIQWPLPTKRTETEGDLALVTYVYEDQTMLLIPLEISKDAPPGPMELAGNVSWQECEKLCVQGHIDVTASLTIGDQSKASAAAPAIEKWKQKVPREAQPKAKAYWESANATGEERAVIVEWETSATNADFFPYKIEGFDVSGKTERTISGSVVRLKKTVSKSEGSWPKNLTGVLVAGTPPSGIEVNLAIDSAPPVAAAAKEPLTFGLLVTQLLSAFLAGLILNIMPCVLPIIALKVLGFVNQSREEAARTRRLSVVYGLGILVSFIALAAVAIAVQRAGGLADWGAAFRNPQFRVIITTVILLVALNLFGVFEITLSGRTMGAASNLASKEGYTGSFFNGVLATLLATPCTAPYLSTAFLYAVSQPPAITILVFIFIGLGLATPFVLLSWFPTLRKFMPKPGAWMERFKIAMGFPMLATALWLFWASAKDDELLWFGFFLVGIAFVAWVWGEFVQRGSRRRALSIGVAAVILLLNYTFILEGKLQWRTPISQRHGLEWKVWSSEAVEKARREGHPVLVDFTAKHCGNCYWNLVTAIEVPQTEAKLKQIGAVTFKADYTDENPVIGKELQHYGRASVPLVLVFPKDASKPPVVMPPLFSKAAMLETLDQVSASGVAQSAQAQSGTSSR